MFKISCFTNCTSGHKKSRHISNFYSTCEWRRLYQKQITENCLLCYYSMPQSLLRRRLKAENTKLLIMNYKWLNYRHYQNNLFTWLGSCLAEAASASFWLWEASSCMRDVIGNFLLAREMWALFFFAKWFFNASLNMMDFVNVWCKREKLKCLVAFVAFSGTLDTYQ